MQAAFPVGDDMSLRVAHVINSLGIGGAERHLVSLLNAMSCDYRAVICLRENSGGSSFERDLDPAIERHVVPVRARSLPFSLSRLASLLRRLRVDVVHTHMYRASLYGALAARMAGVPVVVTTEHGENPWKHRIHRIIERRLISPLTDIRFCVSSKILEIRRDWDGVPASKLRLTVNGTVIPEVPVRPDTNPVPVVGSVGRFIAAKDYPGLVKSVGLLRDRGHEVRLCLVGDGPESGALHETIGDLGLEASVELPGFVDDVPSWYARFDIYVSSSIREGLPVALLEAMAHGLPVIATDVGACSDAVKDGEGGLIVPPGDPAQLADAVARLLLDGELRQNLGRGARERIKRYYSVDTIARMHEDAYQEILSRKRPHDSR